MLQAEEHGEPAHDKEGDPAIVQPAMAHAGGDQEASQPEIPATANMPNASASRPSTCTMPRSWSISALLRGLPSGFVSGTTSVLMASATTS